MRVYFVSSKVTLKCAGSLSVEAQAAQGRRLEDLSCYHFLFP